MAILIDQDTKVICQGLTGAQATYHMERAIAFGTKVVGGVVPGKGGRKHLGLPVFDTVAEAVSATGATDLVVVGAEAHVCVLQTTLDLLHRGYRCHLVEDAVISRREENCRAGIALARQAGALIKSAEMVCFEMLERAGTDAFKTMLRWIK
jgi:succinyl-CoA synthetase alpha subunit